MTEPTIETIQQIVKVTGVELLTITDAVEDGDAFTREVRAYGEAGEGGTRPLLFTLRVSGSSAEKISLTAPAQTF